MYLTDLDVQFNSDNFVLNQKSSEFLHFPVDSFC